jgi:VWFA-related protein
MTTRAALVVAVLLTQAVFRSQTHSVWVNVSVRQGNGPVPGLQPHDFVVHDDGVAQTVDAIAGDLVPVDVTVLLDNSGSMAAAQDEVRADVMKMASLLRPTDRLRLLAIDGQGRVRDLFGWRGGDSPPTLSDLPIGSGSPISDALLLAMIRRSDPDRRHLIFALTDAADWQPVADTLAVIEVAQRTDAVLHVALVQMSDRGHLSMLPQVSGSMMRYRNGANVNRYDNLATAAELTGGRLRDAPVIPSRDRYVTAFRAALEEFRQSYLLRFTLKDAPRPGWHELRVAVPSRSRAEIRARKGYFGDSR